MNSGNRWVFAAEGDNPLTLYKHSQTEVKTGKQGYVKVKSEASPYDGNLIYWSSRMGKSPEMPMKYSKLLKIQKGQCPWCGLHFRNGDELEEDHMIPKSKGGSNMRSNLQLLHKHCHDEKTRIDGSYVAEVPMSKGLSN